MFCLILFSDLAYHCLLVYYCLLMCRAIDSGDDALKYDLTNQTPLRLGFIDKVKVYLGGKKTACPNTNDPLVVESLRWVISFIDSKNPLDYIYDDEPLGFERSEQQEKVVEVKDPWRASN